MSRGENERNKHNFANLVLSHMDNNTNNNDQNVNNENPEFAAEDGAPIIERNEHG